MVYRWKPRPHWFKGVTVNTTASHHVDEPSRADLTTYHGDLESVSWNTLLTLIDVSVDEPALLSVCELKRRHATASLTSAQTPTLCPWQQLYTPGVAVNVADCLSASPFIHRETHRNDDVWKQSLSLSMQWCGDGQMRADT